MIENRALRILPALVVGHHDDPLEREADRVADQLVGGGSAPGSPGLANPGSSLQRSCSCGATCAACSSDDPVPLLRAAGAPPTSHDPTPAVESALSSPGRPLQPDDRSFFEPRLGQDLGGVRVHTNEEAARSAAAVGARAYTVGDHVVFGRSEYSPASSDGRRLLAHELTHVMQQRGANGVAALQRQPTPPPPPAAPAPTAPTAAQQTVIEAARRGAAIRTQIALMRVRGIVPAGPPGQDPATDSRQRARRLAQLMFEWDNPNMDQIEQIIGSMVTQLTNPDVMVGAPGDPECGNRAAYVRGHRPPIVVCPTFFSDTPEQQIRTLIHEAAHLVGIGSSAIGESYCVFFDCRSSCGGFESADSWAHFVHCLTDQTADQPPVIQGRPGTPTPPSPPPSQP